MGQRLPLLTRSARDVPARQQTLRKTIQWSYDLLSTLEQRVFRLLSIFVSGCTLHAIEAIAVDFVDDTTSILDVVASLIDKNLVQQTLQEGEDIRLTMLETIREYNKLMQSIILNWQRKQHRNLRDRCQQSGSSV